MNTNDLHTLMQVSRDGSFAAAARALNMDPSSVSRAVAALEEELGIRIFQRSTRRLRLTESGTAFVERISRVLDELEEARHAAVDATGEVRGKLRLTAPSTFGVERLVPVLSKFCRAHPALEIDFALNEAVVDLIAGGLDLAVRLAPLHDSNLVAVPILDIRYHVVASREWVKANDSRTTKPQDLEDFPCLCMSLPARESWIFRTQGAEPFSVRVHPKFVSTNGVALRELAVAGLGPAMLADWLVASHIGTGSLVELFPGYEVTARNAPSKAWAVYPTRSHVPAKVRLFVEHLRRELGQSPAP
jgi:DNA-binding transcriptional LysR family regulator